MTPPAHTEHQRALLDTALRLRAGGCSLLPINGQTKQPYFSLLPRYCPWPEQPGRDNIAGAATWRPYQTAQATEMEIACWIAHGAQLAVATGYGGLTILDFDQPGFFEALYCRLGSAAMLFPVQRTGGGGYQLAFRSPRPAENQKLAWVPDASKLDGRSIAIETRGLNGYAVVYPSRHPSGRYYRLLQADFAAIPQISQELADHLLDLARSLCQMPEPLQRSPALDQAMRPTRPAPAVSPIRAFNEANRLEEVLQMVGYQYCHGYRWAPPGASRQRDSVQVDPHKRKAFHYDTDYPLADGYWHDAFDIWAYYKHCGDTRAAARAAATLLCLEYPHG